MKLIKISSLLLYAAVLALLYSWYFYLFKEREELYVDTTDYIVHKIATEENIDIPNQQEKISWKENIEFSYCDNILKYSETSTFWDRKSFFDKEDVVLLQAKIEEYNQKSKNNLFPYFISEYCKNSDGTKYIFSVNDKRPLTLWIYDKEGDIIKKALFQYKVFPEISFWAWTWRRNYWDLSLEKYYEDYRKEKLLQSWFWKKEGNIVNYVNYGVSLIWDAKAWLRHGWKVLSEKNLHYCTKWLTPAWKLSVCFANVYYAYDISINTLYEDKICPYYIDDEGKIHPLQKCLQNTWKHKKNNSIIKNEDN